MQQAVPQHVVIKQERVDDQPDPGAAEQARQVEERPVTGSVGRQAAGRSKPVLLYVGSQIQGPSKMMPARVTAGAWVAVNTGSPRANLRSNIGMRSADATKQMADLASVYAALSHPELQVLMKDREVLHLISGEKRTVELLHTADSTSKSLSAAVAAQIRDLAAAAPYKVFFMHEPRTKRGAGAAALRQARAAAESCSKHQRSCTLPTQYP